MNELNIPIESRIDILDMATLISFYTKTNPQAIRSRSAVVRQGMADLVNILINQGLVSRPDCLQDAKELLKKVGLDPTKGRAMPAYLKGIRKEALEGFEVDQEDIIGKMKAFEER